MDATLLLQNTTWGFPSPVAEGPSAAQNFPQILEPTSLALHRAPRDALELAEQDVIMTEAFQNRPRQLQKKKKKIQLQTAFPDYPYSLKVWGISEKSCFSQVTVVHFVATYVSAFPMAFCHFHKRD